MMIPLKQGLKQNPRLIKEAIDWSLNDDSIKTRIETEILNLGGDRQNRLNDDSIKTRIETIFSRPALVRTVVSE